MNMASPSVRLSWNPITRAFGIAAGLSAIVLVGILGALGMPLVPIALLTGLVLFVWLAFRYPVRGLGMFLAIMPIFTLAFLIAKFFGPPYIGLLEGGDRVVLILLVFVLWLRNGIRLVTPDWFLLICLALAGIHMFLGGSLLALLSDFNFIIAYAAGRVTKLAPMRERLWANRAVWIVAGLAVLGMLEVFIIGEVPRTVLYLAVGRGGTQGGALDAAFHGEGYAGMRESSTMFGPLQFAPLCMVALVIWWVYSRKAVPGVMIVGGLICSVTRSAWVGTAIAISVVAMLMGEMKRLVHFGLLMLALFIAAVPTLGLTNYLLSTKAGEDPSAQGHRESVFDGVTYMVKHPFGAGPGNVGKFAVKDESTAFAVENSYLTLATEYGVVTALCFIGFLATCVRTLSRRKEKPAYVAIGAIVGFSAVMMFAALHDVFPLACWLWFPVGLAIRAASEEPAAVLTAG